jgi:hypothetical protein
MHEPTNTNFIFSRQLWNSLDQTSITVAPSLPLSLLCGDGVAIASSPAFLQTSRLVRIFLLVTHTSENNRNLFYVFGHNRVSHSNT